MFPAMSEQRETILAKLLAFDTTSRESNIALIGFIQSYLAELGIDCQLFFNEEKSKANLLARCGPDGTGGVMLSGHTDVVPVDGQHWTYPPFQLTQDNERCYGRGAADMKGFIACVLAAIPDFVKQPLRMPLHLAFSYDEEVGCLGVRSLVDYLSASPEKPAMCIVGEPTEMHPVYGHKGKVAMRCQVHGHACHSAYAPQGVNAIEYAAKIIQKLTALGKELSVTEDRRFDPPFSTLQVGVIKGGAALNIVPQDCQFDFEIRHLPDMSVNQLISDVNDYAQIELAREMKRVSAGSGISFSTLSQYPGLLTDPQSEFAGWLGQWTNSDAFSTVAFGTEGGLFDRAGIATLICGPGSMEQGHKPDEYVSVEQLNKCSSMLSNLCKWMAEKSTFKFQKKK